MANRGLLHATHLDAFKGWLTAFDKREWRYGRGPYQVMQISWGHGWQVIYSRLEVKEHYTVPEPLIPLIRKFYAERHLWDSKASSSTASTSGEGSSKMRDSFPGLTFEGTSPTPTSASGVETSGDASSTTAPF